MLANSLVLLVVENEEICGNSLHVLLFEFFAISPATYQLITSRGNNGNGIAPGRGSVNKCLCGLYSRKGSIIGGNLLGSCLHFFVMCLFLFSLLFKFCTLFAITLQGLLLLLCHELFLVCTFFGLFLFNKALELGTLFFNVFGLVLDYCHNFGAHTGMSSKNGLEEVNVIRHKSCCLGQRWIGVNIISVRWVRLGVIVDIDQINQEITAHA